MNILFETLINYSYLKYAFIIAILASIACGITGSFVVKKKMSYVSGGIAHAIMGGIGIAYYFQLNTTIGMLIFAFLFALIITITKINANQDEDTIIGILWAIGMSVGIIFMYITPGYNVDLMSFIFGNILMVQQSDITSILIMDIIIIVVTFFFYNHFLFISFDEEFLKIKGLKVNLFYLILLLLICFTVVILIKIVGLILVIALLTIPAIITSFFTHKMSNMIFFAVILGIIFNVFGLIFAFYLNIPASSSIIILAGLIYFISLVVKRLIIKH